MAKFCGKCGGKLDEKTGYCPNCDVDKLNEQITTDSVTETPSQVNIPNEYKPVKLTRKQKKAIKKANRTTAQKVRSVLIKMLVILLAVLVIISGGSILLAYNHLIEIPVISNFFKGNNDPTIGNNNYIHYDGDFSGKAIKNADMAADVMKGLSGKLGFENALDELSVNSSDYYENSHFFRFQEQYHNIPIYKRSIVAVTDENGNIIEISGNVTDIPEDTIIEPSVAQETVNSNAREYFDKEFSYDCEYFEVQKIKEGTLYLYNLADPKNVSLIYQLIIVTDYGPFSMLINAVDGTILQIQSVVNHIQEEVTVSGQINKQTFIAEKEKSDYKMIFMPVGKTKYTTYSPKDGHMYDYYLSDKNANVISWKKGSETDKSAVDAMANLERVFNYYKEKFSRNSIDGKGSSLKIYVQTAGIKSDDNKDEDYYNNAFYVGKTELGEGYDDIISFPKCYSDKNKTNEQNSYSCELDVVGHEMTHGVVDYTCDLTSLEDDNTPSTINEAISDIFGFFIEAKANKIEPDWSNSVRTAIKENNTSKSQIYHYKDFNKKSDEHVGATIATYAAYLMYNGVNDKYTKLTMSDLERIWYRALLTMPSDSTFQILRYNIESAAINLGFSNEKKQCISAAFDEVGVASWVDEESNSYNTDSDIIVLGKDGQAYDNYTIRITGKKYTGMFHWGWFTEDYMQTINVNSSDRQSIKLDVGNYTIKVIDNVDNNREEKKTIKVNEDGRYNLLKFSTGFENSSTGNNLENSPIESLPISNTTERDVVLVLDASGSMEGTPLEETKKAATKFVDTVMGHNAQVGIVKYDDEAEIVSPFSDNSTSLKSSIEDISSGDSTNIEDGLSTAEDMLSSSSSKKKIIVLMSDGEPNEGKEGDELIEYANELKEKGIYIYTLGFFDELDSDKSSAQYLMEKIASEGCHYEVSDSDSLVYFFGDIADQINGQKYIYVRIACPVDVSVKHNGETLSSSDISLNTRTSFGSLTFEETDTQSYSDSYEDYLDEDTENVDKVKILRLKEGEDYDIKINGTDRGRMNYSIGFMDDDGEYSDFRKFNNVKITSKTKIDTVATVTDKTVMNVDENGDGKYDLIYEATANGRAKLVETPVIIYIILILIGILVLLILILILCLKIRNKRRIRT